MHPKSGLMQPQAWTVISRSSSRSRLKKDKACVLIDLRQQAGEARITSLQQSAAAGRLQVQSQDVQNSMRQAHLPAKLHDLPDMQNNFLQRKDTCVLLMVLCILSGPIFVLLCKDSSS